MMKNLIFIISILVFVSCGEKTQEPKGEIKSYDKDSISVVESKATIEINPAFYVAPNMEGTDFGNFFKTLYKHGQFESMIAFTSSQSIEQFGEEVILDFYKNDLKFGYELGDKPISQTTEGNVITLNYNANIIATKRVVRISVVVENDSCKIVLPNKLSDFPS